ncbi:MAG: helix-turn-helix transcriptional regulator [Pseudomonadota bacterium]
MPIQPLDTDNVSLGDLLRETRIKQGLNLEDVAEGTRISPKNLRAMEESNFAALPAEVFTRGFYAIYAKSLALDSEEILEKYESERRTSPRASHFRTPPPNRLAQNMKNMADRPSSLPFAYFGFILLLLLLFGAFLCWYFSWNPASYLSIKLRSLDASQHVEQVKNHGAQPPAVSQSIFALSHGRKTTQEQPDLLSISSPSLATAATADPDDRRETLSPSGTTKYLVNAVFFEDTKISLVVDDNPQRTITFKDGDQVKWRAVEKLIITLPADTRTKVSLNEIPLQLPQPNNNCITLAIPDSLLR